MWSLRPACWWEVGWGCNSNPGPSESQSCGVWAVLGGAQQNEYNNTRGYVFRFAGVNSSSVWSNLQPRPVENWGTSCLHVRTTEGLPHPNPTRHGSWGIQRVLWAASCQLQQAGQFHTRTVRPRPTFPALCSHLSLLDGTYGCLRTLQAMTSVLRLLTSPPNHFSVFGELTEYSLRNWIYRFPGHGHFAEAFPPFPTPQTCNWRKGKESQDITSSVISTL